MYHPMQQIQRIFWLTMRPLLRRGRFPYLVTRSIGNGRATILISEAHIRFRILNRNRYEHSSSLVAERAEWEGVDNQRV